ncbi:MAG: type II toxin-antitoxin system VapC family toxin [Actinomycetota bacterium]|nr:type II toxin-antitoxin system VapC family toxin [Actinomycetota bacterium]
MIVLDTNVVSELMRHSPTEAVLVWVDSRDSADMAITAVTAAELRAGVACMPRGRRRTAIASDVDALLDDTLAGRVLPFDAESAAYYAEILAIRRGAGSPIEPLDAQIAAICMQHGSALATRNTRDFTGLGLTLLDPWAA